MIYDTDSVIHRCAASSAGTSSSTLSTDSFATLAFAFAKTTAHFGTCRGCETAGVKVFICCAHRDGGSHSSDMLAKAHSQCLKCFKLDKPNETQVHMLAPGNRDECKYCKEDKTSGALPRAAAIGDPLKRPRENDAFNALNAHVKCFNAGVESLKAGEAGEGTTVGTAVRREIIDDHGNSIKAFLEAKKTTDNYPGETEGGAPALETFLAWKATQDSIVTAFERERIADDKAEAERQAEARATQAAEKKAAEELKEAEKKHKAELSAEKNKARAAEAAAASAVAIAAAAQKEKAASTGKGKKRAEPSAAASRAAGVPERTRGVAERSIGEGRNEATGVRSTTKKAGNQALSQAIARDVFKYFHKEWKVPYGKNNRPGPFQMTGIRDIFEEEAGKKRKYEANYKESCASRKATHDSLVAAGIDPEAHGILLTNDELKAAAGSKKAKKNFKEFCEWFTAQNEARHGNESSDDEDSDDEDESGGGEKGNASDSDSSDSAEEVDSPGAPPAVVATGGTVAGIPVEPAFA